MDKVYMFIAASLPGGFVIGGFEKGAITNPRFVAGGAFQKFTGKPDAAMPLAESELRWQWEVKDETLIAAYKEDVTGLKVVKLQS